MENNKPSLIKQAIKYGIPLIISASLCYLLFTGIDFDMMIDIIRDQCDFRWIGLALALAALSHVIRAFRWRIQLRALGIDAPAHALIYSIFGTYAVNLVFPRLGEVWRTGYIAQRQKAPFTTIFGSMVADRLADTATVATMLLACFILASNALLSYLGQNSASYEAIMNLATSPWLWIAGIVCIVAIWRFLTCKTENKWIVKSQQAVKELWQGFAIVLKMKNRGQWLLLTIALWGCYFMQLYVAFYAFPFTTELLATHGMTVAFVAFVLSSIAMGVPSNGGIGPWQWAVIFALGIYGLGKAEASAFANLVLGCNTLLLIVLGIITFIGIALDRKSTNNRTTH